MFFLIKTQEWTFIFFSPQLFSSVTFETVGESKVRPFFCFILGYFLKHLLTVHLRLALNSAFLPLPPVLGLQACAAMPSRDDSLNYRILTFCKLKCEYLILILNLGFFFFLLWCMKGFAKHVVIRCFSGGIWGKSEHRFMESMNLLTVTAFQLH